MRESEKDTLQSILESLKGDVKSLENFIAGKPVAIAPPQVPARAGALPPRTAAPRTAAAPVVEGEVHAYFDEKEGAYGCNACSPPTGPYKAAELAVHLFQDHQLPLAQANIEDNSPQAHGHKWMMKKALEKLGDPAALEGYGRGQKAAAEPEEESAPAKGRKPLPAPKGKTGWFGKKEAAQEPEETIEPKVSLTHPYGCVETIKPKSSFVRPYPYKYGGRTETIEPRIRPQRQPDLVGYVVTLQDRETQAEVIEWNPASSQCLVRPLNGGRIFPIPKKNCLLIHTYKVDYISPQKAPAASAKASSGFPRWGKKAAGPEPESEEDISDQEMFERFGWTKNQIDWVKKFAAKKSMSLRQAAEEIAKEEPEEEA